VVAVDRRRDLPLAWLRSLRSRAASRRAKAPALSGDILAVKCELQLGGTPRSLNAVGSRGSWRAFHKEKKRWQDDLYYSLIAARVPLNCKRIDARATLHFATNRRRDEGNYRSLLEKALGDALQMGGWIEDDTPEFFSFKELTFGDLAKPAATIVTLEVQMP